MPKNGNSTSTKITLKIINHKSFTKGFKMNKTIFTLAIVCMLTIVACNKTPSKTPAKVNESFSKSMILTAKPANAKSILDVKKKAKVGDKVTVVGIVGGQKNNVLGNKAALMHILDESTGFGCTCSCKTPWDYCCTAPETLTKNKAIAKFQDSKGKTIKGSCENFAGLRPLVRVYITGEVQKLKGDSLTIIPEKIFVEQTPAAERAAKLANKPVKIQASKPDPKKEKDHNQSPSCPHGCSH